MSTHPESWATVQIGTVTQVTGGGTPPSSEPGCFAPPGTSIPWITPADLSGHKQQHISHGNRDLTQKGLNACSAKLMPAGSVLFSSRAPIGYVAIAAKALATNQGFKSFILPTEIDSRFTYYQLRHLKPVAEAMATGTTFKEISGGSAAKLPFLVAPSKEQTRIADKLDAVLSRVDDVNARLDRVAPLLKRFRQSVLAAATSGRLTEDWRQGKSAHWTVQKLSTLVNSSTTGIVRSALDQSEISSDKTPYLKMNSIHEDWSYSCDEVVGIKCSPNELSRFELKEGDWLFNTRNSVELVGKSCVWKGPKGFVFNNNLLRVRFNKNIVPDWIEIFMRSPHGRSILSEIKSATTSVAAIYQRSLMDLKITVPETDEQTEIVRRVDILFAFADRLEARLKAARTAAQRLTPAVLAKAFRGELVAQDPADEPAAELLKRLAAQRAQDNAGTGRGRRGRTARA